MRTMITTSTHPETNEAKTEEGDGSSQSRTKEQRVDIAKGFLRRVQHVLLFFLPLEGDTLCIAAREASFATNY